MYNTGMGQVNAVNSSEASQPLQFMQQCCDSTKVKVTLVVIGILLVTIAVIFQVYVGNEIATGLISGVGGVIILGTAIASVIQWVRRRGEESEER